MKIDDLPILGICGWSGSGKTTLLEQIIPQLTSRGLKVAVIKHDAHGIDIDRPGKDSDRFYQAGADVLLQGPGQDVLRVHRTDDADWTPALAEMAEQYDLVLVEGHKSTDIRKVWLSAKGETAPPEQARNIAAVLPWDSDRLASVMGPLEEFLAGQWLKTPVVGCVMIGGKSRRMGTPKHLLVTDGKTWLARTVELLQPLTESIVIAGAGEIPANICNFTRLTDSPDARGPMSGLLAAMRWRPRVSWLVVACDLPNLSADALSWLLTTRKPGIWASIPALQGDSWVEPLLAHYDFRVRAALEEQAINENFRLGDVVGHPKVISPEVPADLAAAWRNVNTQAELES